MKVKLIPEKCDEETVEKLRQLKADAREDELYDYNEINGSSSIFDALYYASENGESALQEQEQYFLDLLLNEERPYYFARMGFYDEEI